MHALPTRSHRSCWSLTAVLVVLFAGVSADSVVRRIDPPRPSEFMAKRDGHSRPWKAGGTGRSKHDNQHLTSSMIQHASVPSGVDLSKYTPCPRTPEPDNYDDMDDAAYFVYKLKMAKYYPLPFKYMFFCDMFKPELYSEIVRHFPPTTVMEPAVKRAATEMKKRSSYSAAGSNNLADRRWKMSAFDIIAMKPTSKWPTLASAQPIWSKLKEIVFSKEVADTLWERFNLTRVANFHDFRVQSDHSGYSIGVHPDSPKKILTLMFYVPLDANTVYDYGTCLHTSTQYQARDLKKNGEGVCMAKFLYASNTGYSFVVNDISYHSVNNVGRRQGYRQTIMFNWYDQVPNRVNKG